MHYFYQSSFEDFGKPSVTIYRSMSEDRCIFTTAGLREIYVQDVFFEASVHVFDSSSGTTKTPLFPLSKEANVHIPVALITPSYLCE